ncbi:MAG: M50 family metallopeptidase [Sporichthyaceae bacterium]
MLTLIGVLLFVGLLVMSVAIHEFGHLLTAKAYGMKATEYFIGFGPKLWSFRRGETEYGFKAIPAGGYVKIVGMTDLEPVDESDRPRAFYNYSAPKKLVVLSAGSISHMFVAFFLFVLVFMAFGTREAVPTVNAVAECIPAATTAAAGTVPPPASGCAATDPPSPAKAAGLLPGDEIVEVAGTPVADWEQASRVIRATGAGPLEITVLRGGAETTLTAELVTRERPDLDNPDQMVTVGVLGVEPVIERDRSGPIDAATESVQLIGTVIKATGQVLTEMPEKIENLFKALSGDERDPEGLVGVVGIARISGETLSFSEAALSDRIAAILIQVAALNVFIGLFNALPLLPLDGGHMAVVSYEHGRRRIYLKTGRADPGRVDMNKLLPLAYGFLVVIIGLTVLLLAADVINPITLT